MVDHPPPRLPARGLNPSTNPPAEGTLHLQMANLLVDLVDLNVLGFLFQLLVSPQKTRRTLYQDYSPCVYLTSVYFEPAGQSGDSLFPQEGGQDHLRFESWAVFLAFLFHVLPLNFCNSRCRGSAIMGHY